MDRLTNATLRTTQVPPLRFASAEMTRGGSLPFRKVAAWMDGATNRYPANTQVSKRDLGHPPPTYFRRNIFLFNTPSLDGGFCG
jgi:hypothetical protein